MQCKTIKDKAALKTWTRNALSTSQNIY